MITVILAAIIPAIVLVYFIYRKDKYEKEPTAMLLKGFGFGALSALASSFISNPLEVMGFFSSSYDTIFGAVRHAVFGAAIPEELAKLFFLWLLLRKNKYFNEYADGIVYAVCIGMGFAALENIGYLFTYIDNWGAVGVLRALFTIPAHFFFAVIMGYYYSKASFGDPAQHKHNLWMAFLIPAALHAAFDGLLMASFTAGAIGSGLFLFLGLYIYMAITAKKRFAEHMAKDESNMTNNQAIADSGTSAEK